MFKAANVNINSPVAVTAIIVAFSVSVLVFLLMPVYVGALADSYGYSNEQLGWVISIELLGQVIAGLFAMFWIRELSWRKILVLCGATLVAVNALAFYVDGVYNLLLVIRCVSGLAVGSILAIGCAALGDTEHPDRNFGFLIATQVLISGVLFAILPQYISVSGVTTLFVVFGVAGVIVILATVHIADEGLEHQEEKGDGIGNTYLPVIGLIATALFFAGVIMVYSFVERLGVIKGFSADQIGFALSVGMIVSIAGALAASALGDSRGRTLPMIVSMTGLLLSLFILLEQSSYAAYLGGLAVMMVFWNLWVPYQMSAVASVDISGRFTVLIPVAQSLGVTAAPTLSGQLLGNDNFLLVFSVAAILLVISLWLFKRINRKI